jgi:hypothetical protein
VRILSCIGCTILVDGTFSATDGFTFEAPCGSSHCYEASLDSQENYVFASWEGEVSSEMTLCTSNLTVTAVYDPVFTDGEVEGQPEGAVEGAIEGVLEGEGEGGVDVEGEGESEGHGEGEGEGEPVFSIIVDEAARLLLASFSALDTNNDRELSLEECLAFLTALFESKGAIEFYAPEPLYAALNDTASNGLTVGELRQAAGNAVHAADTNANGSFDLSELLRVIQLANAGEYGCAQLSGDTEDGFALVFTGRACTPHSADTTEDWSFNLSELLRAIQIYNVGAYTVCVEGEDGVCL